MAAESPVAKAVELHTHTNDGGVMRMRKIDSITVPAGGMTMLKPGGVMGVVEHVGAEGADNTSLHRMQPGHARAAATAAGFVIQAESDLLANPDDDHSLMVFNEDIRGKTDRFILKLRKPE